MVAQPSEDTKEGLNLHTARPEYLRLSLIKWYNVGHPNENKKESEKREVNLVRDLVS